MYKKPITPKATNKKDDQPVRNLTKRGIPLHLIDFELWLENELVKLEAKYASFTTTTSNRKFFDQKTR